MNIGIIIPHIFAQDEISKKVIFAPIHLALSLISNFARNKIAYNIEKIYLFTPGEITIPKGVININTDLSFFEAELQNEKCTLDEFINKNPLAFISLSRQINAQLTAEAFQYAKDKKIDLLHVFMCEDEIPLYFSNLLEIPLLFTNHDPFNFYRKYRARFPILKNLNYVSISDAQRKSAPKDMNFISTVYNGVELEDYKFNSEPKDQFCFIGRIIQNKGCHIAIQAAINTNSNLKIAGKHYADSTETGETYWEKHIQPYLNNKIEYLGYLEPPKETSKLLRESKALLFPIEWEEPFGMVMIEALACGTPVIAFNKSSVPEIIEDGKNGFIVNNQKEMENAIQKIDRIDRKYCRQSALKFSAENMASGYFNVYKSLINQ